MTVTKWVLGLAGIAVLAWYLIGQNGVDTPAPPSVSEGPPTAVEPGRTENTPLTAAELRWCMTEEARLEAIRPHLATHPAVDRYNELAADFNSRCGGRSLDDEDRDEVMAATAASRQSIVAAAIADIQRINDGVPLSAIRAQELLSMLGYDPGLVDGVYGAQTRAAIEAFQNDKGILVDGLLSRELLDQMVLDLARDRTGRTERVTISVYVTRENSNAPISGAEVTIWNDQGLQSIRATNERGRAEFASVHAGNLEILVRQDGTGLEFQAVITEESRQEVWVVVP